MKNYKPDFPFLNNNNVIYLDSGSTSIKPKCVIDTVNDYLQNYPLTENRSNSKYTRKINKEIEETKNLLKNLINANFIDEIIFTNGATDASNIITSKFGINYLNNNDEILLCKEDHSSTISPWLNLQTTLEKFNTNIIIKDILIDKYGNYQEDNIFSKITDKTKFIILTHIHNIYGIEMNIEYIVNNVKKINSNCKIVLDASQSVGHIPVDIKKLNIDFLYFSTHKMFALTGCDILWVKKENFNLIPNIKDLKTGTQNTIGIIALKPAIEYINKIRIGNIESHVLELTRYLLDKLKTIPGIIFNKGIANIKCALGYGIISFKINNISVNELVQILDEYNVIVRANNFCNNLDSDYIRLSLHIYNTIDDIDKFIKILNYIIKNA